MEGDREELKTFVLQELSRLGIKNEPNKKRQSAKKSKSKQRISPVRKTKSPTQKSHTEKKNTPKTVKTPKSPFKSNKRRAELRQILCEEKRKGSLLSGQVFGQALSEIPAVCVYMNDGSQVTVPEFLVDICNLIRSNITTEGIFRKAGSSQRQTEIKKIIDSGNPLPNTVHVIDAACLLKKFLHWLPEPLLSPEVYTLCVRCLKVNDDLQRDAFILCTLLLPLPQRETLAYLMDFLGDVAAASGMNLMDSHNLAIVLAPNFFPIAPPPNNHKGNHLSINVQHTHYDLTTNIEVIQAMIKNCAVICRIPNQVAVELKERSQSIENLLNIEQGPIGSARKKRRSASIHRVMTGLRRFVGQSSGSSGFSPMLSTGSADHLDQLHSYPGCTLSPLPLSPLHQDSEKKGKRKSADAFDFCQKTDRERFQNNCYFNDSVPASKRAKVDLMHDEAIACSSTSKDVCHLGSNDDDFTSPPHERKHPKVGRSHTVRDLKGARDLLSQPKGHYFLGNAKTTIKRSKSTFIRGTSSTKAFDTQAFQNGMPTPVLPLNDKVENSMHFDFVNETPPIVPLRATSMHHLPAHTNNLNVTKKSSAVSNAINKEYPQTLTPKRPMSVRRSLDSAIKKMEGTPRRHSGIKRRMSGNEPDGATICSTIGQRGEPDGAECNLRDFPSSVPITNKPLIQSLEEHYDDIKSVVKSMEEEVDKNNIQQLKDTFLSDNSTSSVQNRSCSEMIQNAYERMKEESKDLENSPTVCLSKRLGKELHIHKRRSAESRVMRSPSERKIGTIRRRSRELAQNAAKSLVNVEDTPKTLQTPKLKGTLMQTPLRLKGTALQTPLNNTSLKRGRPNSLKVGLPLVVRNMSRSSENISNVGCIDDAVNKTVRVNKRLEDSFCSTPTSTPNRSRRRSLQTGRRSSDSVQRIGMDKNFGNYILNENSSLHHKEEPLTHNTLASFTSPLKDIMSRQCLQSNENSFTDNIHEEKIAPNVCQSSYNININHFSKECNDISGKESEIHQMPPKLDSEMEVDEEWVPGEQYLNDIEPNDAYRMNVEGGRPSIVALKKQKKVTSNVHLFNNIHNTPSCVTPSHSNLYRFHGTPYTPCAPIPLRNATTDHQSRRHTHGRNSMHRSTMTPREILKVKQRSQKIDLSNNMHSNPKVAIVTPLKESTWINIQTEHSKGTPIPYKGEAVAPVRPPRLKDLKTPNVSKPQSCVSQNQTPNNIHSKTSSETVTTVFNTPKLPPRSLPHKPNVAVTSMRFQNR